MNCKYIIVEIQYKYYQYVELKKVVREVEREMVRWGNSFRGEYLDRGNVFMFIVYSLSFIWYNKQVDN